MACIEHYIQDAESIFDEIGLRQRYAQDNAYKEYGAARTIQRWFRGYITRKYLKHLNSCATIIQKHWRGYADRKYYSQLLKDAVHKLYWEHYNQMATVIQRVWRGHFVRKNVFSYYKLKKYINGVLEKNREFLEQAKMYEGYTEKVQQKQMQRECQEWLSYLSFRVHHLIRTHQIEGVYSNRGTFQYSEIEQHLKKMKFTDYMDMKHAKAKQNQIKAPAKNYIFKGRLRECEEVWLHRNDPGKYSLATGEYGSDTNRYLEQQKTRDKLTRLQETQMQFGPVRFKDVGSKLDDKQYECPPLHRTGKPVSGQ